MARMEIVERRGIKLNRWDTPTPAVGRCSCGKLVSLSDPLDNECECGRIYNMAGQEVRARSTDCDEQGVPLSDYEG